MNGRFMFSRVAWVFFLCLSLFIIPGESYSAAIKDTESASHDLSAAEHEIAGTYEYPGVKIIQFNLSVLSHYSYMVVSAGEALVVDPDRDIRIYLETAQKEGWTIKGVFLTHSNADFVAGHTEFFKKVGCPVFQNKDSGALYKTQGLSHGRIIPWGEASLKFLSTPGHTPDGMSALVFAKDDPARPRAILTGDTLFVGSIGRPDLMGGTIAAATLAGMGYDTWKNTLSVLGDDVLVLPAHGAGSLCGLHLRDEPSSTIGAERATNPFLQHKGRNDFITAVLEGLPQAPQYFKHNAQMNREGPPPVNWEDDLPLLKAVDSSLSDTSRFFVLDLREAESFAKGHIPNSVNIALRGRLETWVGIIAPWGSRLILCGSPGQRKEAAFRLHRVGYTVLGGLSIEDWKSANMPVIANEEITPGELYKRMQSGAAPVIVDVRLPNEWMGLRIGNVLNMPLNELGELSSKLDPKEPVVTVCNSAYRSSLGIGLLERRGFKKVASMVGGGEAWIEAGLPVIQPTAPGTPRAEPQRVVKLPDIIDSAQLKRMLMDIPGAFDLVDIRPSEHFHDYNLPGSFNAHIADLINNPAYLTGAGPLVIVDRNGTLAMVAGGIISQKTEREVKVLFGGLNAYWEREQMGEPVKAIPIAPPTPSVRPKAPRGPQPAIPQAPQKPKKKSAGC